MCIRDREKVLGSSLEASVLLYCPKEEALQIENEILENISIISELKVVHDKPQNNCYISESDKNIGVYVSKVNGSKCERCWKYFTNLNNSICSRCEDAISCL